MKRLFDAAMSLLALVLLSPLLATVALVVFLDDGGPVIYRQQRVGKGNELFWIRKFRTMRKDTKSCAQQELKNEDCRTRSGKILRALSLDELPQLWNILKGEMSFVGPRPLIPEEKEIRQLRAQAGIFDLLPGLTGWAQVNGRANVTVEEKVALDAEYRAKHSLWMDVKIFFRTFLQVLARKDVG
ncbi:MAG: sugar transferase [Oscillospiraceae bacterium]|jgi:O-antigen biosynthesis protein WbqP|nr:sugar transferase [Oscillospiraceae bacterium]